FGLSGRGFFAEPGESPESRVESRSLSQRDGRIERCGALCGQPRRDGRDGKNTAAIAANVTGSLGLTPTSIDVIVRVTANAAAAPIKTPGALRRRPWRVIVLDDRAE